jgi:TRAP-type C4-dicarboxylate transport system permease small subunit
VRVGQARRRVETAERRLQDVMVTVAGLVLIGMTLIIVYNVVARYVFNQPLDALVSIVEQALMVLVVYLAIAAPAHISIRLVLRFVPRRAVRFIDTATWLLSALLFTVSAVAAFSRAQSSRATGESTVGVVTFAVYPYRYVVAFGLLAAALHVLVVGRTWVDAFAIENVTEEAEDMAGTGADGSAGTAGRRGE